MTPDLLTTELYWLALTALMTGLFWVPYVLNRIAVRGLMSALGNPSSGSKPHAPWAQRAMAAHQNAVENLLIFAALVLAAHAAGASGEATATAAMVYFFARFVHFAVYTMGWLGVRTLAFTVGWLCQMTIGLAIIGVI
jgi:uncharacterized MAPEG superfamily protein